MFDGNTYLHQDRVFQPVFPTAAFSMSLWVTLPYRNYEYFFWTIGRNSTNTVGEAIWQTGRYYDYWGPSDSATGFSDGVYVNTFPTENVWVNIGVSRNGTTLTHYLNGVPNGQSNSSVSVFAYETADMTIGGDWRAYDLQGTPNPLNFDGQMSFFGIWPVSQNATWFNSTYAAQVSRFASQIAPPHAPTPPTPPPPPSPPLPPPQPPASATAASSSALSTGAIIGIATASTAAVAIGVTIAVLAYFGPPQIQAALRVKQPVRPNAKRTEVSHDASDNLKI